MHIWSLASIKIGVWGLCVSVDFYPPSVGFVGPGLWRSLSSAFASWAPGPTPMSRHPPSLDPSPAVLSQQFHFHLSFITLPICFGFCSFAVSVCPCPPHRASLPVPSRPRPSRRPPCSMSSVWSTSWTRKSVGTSSCQGVPRSGRTGHHPYPPLTPEHPFGEPCWQSAHRGHRQRASPLPRSPTGSRHHIGFTPHFQQPTPPSTGSFHRCGPGPRSAPTQSWSMHKDAGSLCWQ